MAPQFNNATPSSCVAYSKGTATRFAAQRLHDDSELDALRQCSTQMEKLDGLTIDTFAVYNG